MSMAAKPKIADLSDAVQDYLREIYKLQLEHGQVKTSTLAMRMGVAPPSATAMMKKLASPRARRAPALLRRSTDPIR